MVVSVMMHKDCLEYKSLAWITLAETVELHLALGRR
jgi:hypothetical protein